jgi:plasmid stabilization system protein ParE
MRFSVSILTQARRDIDRNADWWAEHHSVDQALRWSDAVYDQLASLADFPESHGLSAENDDFPYEIRDKLVGLGSRPGYRAIFTIQAETVYVLSVRRSAQDAIQPCDIDAPPAE